MQITLKIDGKDKTFIQKEVNFATVSMAVEWMRKFGENQDMLVKYIEGQIDDENFDITDYSNPAEDLIFTAQLITQFFNGQFTYDELWNGLYVNEVQDFYQYAFDIFNYIQGQQEKKTNKPIKAKVKKSN